MLVTLGAETRVHLIERAVYGALAGPACPNPLLLPSTGRVRGRGPWRHKCRHAQFVVMATHGWGGVGTHEDIHGLRGGPVGVVRGLHSALVHAAMLPEHRSICLLVWRVLHVVQSHVGVLVARPPPPAGQISQYYRVWSTLE